MAEKQKEKYTISGKQKYFGDMFVPDYVLQSIMFSGIFFGQ